MTCLWRGSVLRIVPMCMWHNKKEEWAQHLVPIDIVACCQSDALYCCDRKSRVTCAQSFAQWQQATIEIILAISLTIACSRYIYYGVILHAHPVRGESHNHRNTTREVATTSPPFYNELHWSHVLCVKAELGTTFTSWSQHHFVAIGNPERHVCKALHGGSKQQQRSCSQSL